MIHKKEENKGTNIVRCEECKFWAGKKDQTWSDTCRKLNECDYDIFNIEIDYRGWAVADGYIDAVETAPNFFCYFGEKGD